MHRHHGKGCRGVIRESRGRLREAWATPVGRGAIMLALMSFAFGFSLSVQDSLAPNFFEDELGLSGPQFGYITAIREVPGFLMIFITALFYRVSLQRLTAMALVVMAIGQFFFTSASSFWTLAPFVVIVSMGYHTVLQTQTALGMNLTIEAHSGRILGTVNAIWSAGTLAALTFILAAFHFDWVSFPGTFMLAGVLALIGAIAIFDFPHLIDGKEQKQAAKRDPIVLRRAYIYYYLLNILDGGRQQVLFSFGLWVLVDHYDLSASQVSGLLIAVTVLSILTSRKIGRLVDIHGERRMLGLVNIGYVISLIGYALAGNVYLAASCYLIYSFIRPLSSIGASTYLRKVAVSEEIAPSLAMGVSLQHAAAIIVPITVGFTLNYVGYQIPFLIAACFAATTIFVTRRLDPETQKSPARVEEELRQQAAALAPAQ
jgi:predicted MFS family arabinose efflux permease